MKGQLFRGNGMVGVKLHADGGFFCDSSDGFFCDLDFSRFSSAAATSSSIFFERSLSYLTASWEVLRNWRRTSKPRGFLACLKLSLF